MRLLLVFLIAWAASAQEMYQFSVDQDRLSGAPDFSSLNEPLGPAERLFIRQGHFYRVGPDREPFTSDDERVMLYGTNLVFGGCFPEEKDAARLAQRLRRLGINLVRLHHMDTSPDENPGNARSILTTGPYPTLNDVSVRRLRILLDAFSRQGIYVNLNLHVGYRFRPFVDGIPAMPGGAEIPTQSKPLHIFYPRMVEKQLEYTRSVIRALRLRGNVALGMVELDNEASLLFSWQGNNFSKLVAGAYEDELKRQWNTWLRDRYVTPEAVCRAWDSCPPGESLASGLSLVTVDQTGNQKRMDDFLAFLEHSDRKYLEAMLQVVRAETDELVPVAGTQMWFGGPLNYDSHAGLDYQDNHFYIDHYNFPNQSWDSRDWRIRDSSNVGAGLERFITMAVYREAGRPYTVSEYNQAYPNRQGAEIDPTLAIFGAFQDWDSIMHFAYSHGRNWDEPAPSSFDLNGDWQKWPLAGQSAWLFRSGVIQPGGALVEIPLSREMKLRATRERKQRNFAQFLEEALGVAPEMSLVRRVAVVHEDRPAPQAAREQRHTPFHADTGQWTYDKDARRMVLHDARAAGVFGYARPGEAVRAGDLELRLAESARGFVTLLTTPLDGKPLSESRRMLLSVPGYVMGTQPGSLPVRPKNMVNYDGDPEWWTLEKDPGFEDRPSGNRQAELPVWMERVECVVTLKTSAANLVVYPLGAAGERLTALSPEHVRPLTGGFEIHLQADGPEFSPWYEVTAPN